MKLSFDKFERYEVPQVTLCNPNSRATEVDGKITITDAVGVLSNPKGMNLKLNFNAPHELSFDYYRHKDSGQARVPIEYIVEVLDKNNKVVKQIDTFPSYEEAEKCVDEFDLSILKDGEYLNIIKQSFYDSIYEAIQTDRYIYLTDIGYFIISSVTDSDEDNIDKKSISCKSCEENELAIAEGLYLEEGTYYLHTEDNKGLLDLFLPKTAGWTMGYIDPSLLTKPYFVEDTEVDNGYNFLYTTTQDMFECIVEPDIIKRTISVYSRVYYAEHHLTDIHIAKYNLLKHKTVEENDEDKYTALNVQGKDENLEIRVVNPTGKNVIYNFEPRYAWMSTTLQIAVAKWQEKCESVEDEYLTIQRSYYTELEKLFNEEKNIEVLNGELDQLEATKDAAWTMVDGDEKNQSLINVNKAIAAKQTEINMATSAYNSHKASVQATYEEPINQINTDCALDITAVDIDGNAIFTAELLNELMTHIKPTDYVDEYMLVTESMTYPQKFEKAKELMDRAQSQLVKISSGQKTYSIDTRSFLFNKQFKHFSKQLCAGAIIYVETKNDIMEQLHLTGIDINFDEKTADFTLGNKYDRSDLKALYDDALGQNSKSFSELKYIASIIEDQQKQLDYQRNWVADLRTLTLDNVLTSEDQAIEINNRGLIGRKRQLNEDGSWKTDENGNPLFDPEQVKLINNTLVFTDKNWQNATTAVGKIAVGYNSDGSVKYAYGINGQVLIGELILGNNLVLTGTGAGIKIKDSSGNDTFYADENGNLVLSGIIFANKGKIGNWEISPAVLQNTSGVEFNDDGSWKSGYRVGMASVADESSAVFFAGVPNKSGSVIGTGKFYVTNGGYLYSENGKVGGWNIGTTALTKRFTEDDTDRYVFMQAGGQGTSNAFAVKHKSTTETSWTDDFYVTYNGKLFAKNADIAGGTIADWTIKNDTIYGVSGSNKFLLSSGSSSGDWMWAHNGNEYTFYVTKTGKLVSKDAEITGTLKAKSIIATGVLLGSSQRGKLEEYTVGTTTGIRIRSLSGYNYLAVSDLGISISCNNDDNTTSYGHLSFSTNGTPSLNAGQNTGSITGDWQVTGNMRGSTSGSIVSDINKKNSIHTISESYSVLFDNLRPVTYKYNDGTSDRLHTGFIAQEVGEALQVANIDFKDFAGLVICNSQTEDELWTLRYEEFIALNTWQTQKLKLKVVNLENTVAELKAQIQTLTAG